jgi:23S rRNA (guanosine2251-2'-O)-methyltransferase
MAKKEETRYVAENLFEGIVSFRALVEAQKSDFNNRKIQKVYYAQEKLQKSRGEYLYVQGRCREYGASLELCSREKIDEMTIGTSHGGIALVAGDREIPDLSDGFIKENGFYVMIDGVEDPYNFGYALRSLYAAGVDGIILTPRNWLSAAGVVCRSSAGASEMLPMAVCNKAEDLLLFKEKGYKIVCADIDNSVCVYEADMKKPILLIVGGERRGISKSVMELADTVVRLDYGREFLAALSTASAATILGFEVYRQEREK